MNKFTFRKLDIEMINMVPKPAGHWARVVQKRPKQKSIGGLE